MFLLICFLLIWGGVTWRLWQGHCAAIISVVEYNSCWNKVHHVLLLFYQRAERQTRMMDSVQYAEFCESRQLSFCKYYNGCIVIRCSTIISCHRENSGTSCSFESTFVLSTKIKL